MAKKDDFSFDSDMDWPDLDFDDPAEPSNNREPVSKVKKAAKQAAKGAGSALADQQRIRKTASKLLPGRHSDVATTAFELSDLLKETGSQLGNEASKTKREVQTSLRRFNRETKNMFPDKVSKLLEKLGGTDDSYYGSGESDQERRQRQTESTLTDVFGQIQKEQTEEKRVNAAKELRSEVLQGRRYRTQLQLFTSIDNSLKQVTSHNDIDLRFKRKQLELQLQQNLLIGDLVESVGGMKKDMLEELKAVVKNTALPEAAKIELTEEFKRVNAQRLMEKLGGGLYGGLGDYLGRTGKNINKRLLNSVGGKLRDWRSNLSGGLDAAGEMIRMQREMADQGEDDTLETIIQMATGLLFDKGVSKYGDGVKSWLGKRKLFKGSSGMADNAITQGAQYLNFQAGLRNTRDGLSGQALDFLRSLLDRTTLNTGLGSFGGMGDMSVDDPKLKRLSMKTIVNIIPGLLARIHHEAVKARTGDDSVPMIRYNMETGMFTDSRKMVGAVRDTLISKGTAGANTEAMDRIMKGVVDTSDLTGSQKTLLRNHIAHLSMRQLPFDPSLIVSGAMPIFGEGSTEDRIALKKALTKTYGLGKNGVVDGDFNSYQQKVADSAKQISSMRYNLQDPRSEILKLVEKGHAEELMALGVLREQNGQVQIDFDRVNEMRFNESLGADADILGGNFAPKGMRELRGGKVINNILNTTNQNNILNSLRTSSGGGWGKDDAYNSQYQSMALEEIIDVLKEGQLLNKEQMENLNQTVRDIVNDPEGRTYNAQYQTMVLEEIMDILQDGRQYANIGNVEGMISGAARRVGGFLGNMKRSITGKFNKGMDFLRNTTPMKMFRGARDFVKDRFKKNRDFVKGKYEKVRDKVKEKFNDIQDWYRDGEWRPALEARKLAARKYIDEKTGLAVEKLSEVKGNILELMEDGSTRIAVAYEELREGLRTMGGRKFIVTKLNAAKDWIGNKIDKALGRHRHIKDKIVGAIKGTYGRGKSFLFGLPDVYVKGETKPRMLAIMAKQGAYQNIDGDEVRTLNDIKGEVRNRNFEMVLSEDDIKLGLVDADGNDLSMFAPGLKGLVQRLLAAPGALIKKIRGLPGKFGNMVTGAKTRVKRAFKGLGGLLKGFTGGIMGALRSAWNTLTGSADSPEEEMLNVAYAQLEVQGNILDQVVALRKKGRKGKWDGDGDGIIDGSWRDLLSRRKKKKEEEKTAEGEKKDSPLISLLKKGFGLITTIVGPAIGMLGDVMWDAIKWLGALMLGKTGLDSLSRRLPGRGNRPGTPGSPGRNAPGRNGRTPPSGPGRRAPGRGKAAIIGTVLTGIGLGGWAMDSDAGDALSTASEFADVPDKTRTAQTTRTAAQTAQQATRARLMQPIGKEVTRLGIRSGWRLLLNPYVAAAAAVVGGYMWYDYRKPRKLQHARLTQYGVDRDDADTAKRYLSFEEWFIKNSKTDSNGKVTFGNLKTIDICNAMNEHLGDVATSDNGRNKSLTWFSNRFVPVYGAWMKNATAFKKADSFVRLDDSMSMVQARDMFKTIRDAGADVVRVELPGSDKTLAPSFVSKKLKELEEEINEAAGGVDTADGSRASLTTAGLNNALAVYKGDTEITGVPGGKLLGYAAMVNPVFMTGKVITGYFQGVLDQYSSAKSVVDLADLKIEKGPLDPLRTVRMKVYGLVEMDLPLVNALIKLEAYIVPDVKYSGRNTAVYKGDSKAAIDRAIGDFGINPNDPQMMPVFAQWFDVRFMPAFMAYLGACHEAKISDPLRAHLSATKTQQYHAANTMVGTSTTVLGNVVSVWRTQLHPVDGKRPNADPSSVKGNMETLLAAVKESELSEISGEKGNILTSIAKKAANITSKFTDLKNRLVDKAASFLPKSVGDRIKSWFGGPQSMTSGGQTPTSPGSAYNQPGGSYTASLGEGAMVNFDPAGGKYGNVNDIPLPTAPRGFEAHMDLIAATAKMTGVDPGILAGLFATESSFDSRAKPGTSSAKGIGQFIDTTWNAMVKKYGHLFGIKEGTSPNDPRANALMTVMYMKDNAEEIKRRLGKQNITDVDLYLAHFLGPHGYEVLYKNPGASAAKLLPDAAESNAPIFYDNGRERTAAEVLQIQANKQIKNRGIYGPQMHAYVRSKGGTVDPSALNTPGGLSVDLNQMGQQNTSTAASGGTPSGVSTDSATVDNYDELGFGPVKAPTAGPVMTIDGGGVPAGPGAGIAPGAATVVRTAAQAGSDITALPPPAIGADTAAAVQAATQTRVQAQAATAPRPAGDSTGQELVRLGTAQVNLLTAINQGIEALVKLSSNIQQTPAPRAVNGQAPMPMSVSKPSSV